MSLRQSNASGKHSISRSPTLLSRVIAWLSSAPLRTNPTLPGRKSHLLLACWRVSKGTRFPTSSFKRTATALPAHSKQGAPRASTAIHRERKLGSKAQGNHSSTGSAKMVKVSNEDKRYDFIVVGAGAA